VTVAGRIVYIWDPKTQALLRRLSDVPFDALDERDRHVLEKDRYNCPPASHLPVVARRDGRNELVVARWGFPIPQRPSGVFNARIENVASSGLWRGMWGAGHCAFVVRGFYEWRRDDRTPFFLHRTDGQPMVLGGLVGERTVQGETKLCFSLVTCPPNGTVARVHDRMPVVLEPDDARAWIDAEATGEAALAGLAVPAAEGVLSMHPVGPDVGSIHNDRPDLMEPRGPEVV